MKTAMQEYFEYAENQGVVFTEEFKNGFLEKEKQQIIDAHEQAYIDQNLSFRAGERAEEYFKNKFG